jgi:hypothetical protein
MDLTAIIRYLYAEREKLERAISGLEKVQQSSPTEGSGSSIDSTWSPSIRRRGRKSMGESERQEVSKRIKEYWSKRRKGQDTPPAT